MSPLRPLTLAAAAAVYLGCTDRTSLVKPGTPAGNAVTTASPSPADATGYWLVRPSGAAGAGHAAIRQNADGTLVGELSTGATNSLGVNAFALQAGSKNNGGAVTVVVPQGTVTGTISADGASLTLTNGAGNDPNSPYVCTRLF